MTKLVLFASNDHQHFEGASLMLPATDDIIRNIANRTGEPVLLARRTSAGTAAEVFVLGLLEGLVEQPSGLKIEVSEVRQLINAIPLPAVSGYDSIVLSDEDYLAIIEAGTAGIWLDEGPATFEPLADETLSYALAERQRYVCCYSGVTTDDGVAVLIRPLSAGGQMALSNMLFVDAEPAELFKRYAWSVGRTLELLINVHAVNPDVIEAASPTGQLVVARENRPDPAALTWHREQFIRGAK